MAHSEMTEHLSTSKTEHFCTRALPGRELATLARHLVTCSDCHQELVATLGRQRGDEPLNFTLAPEFWLRHDHIDYEQLVELAENELDTTDRELIELHLQVCKPCQEDVQSFLVFRKQIAPEMEVSYGPIVVKPTREKLTWWKSWRGLTWKPIYAAALLVVGIALIMGGLFLKRRADDFEARKTPTPNVNLDVPSQTSTADSRVAAGPSPRSTPNESRVEKPRNADMIVALHDGTGMVTVDKGGNVSGLEHVPAPTRDEIASILLSERIEPPAVLKELAGQEATLRGGNNRQSFTLISPTRTVLVLDKPRFKWERVSRASTYRVYVSDPTGQEVARSEELSADHTEWAVLKPLRRGEIYIWTVVAVVDGREIVSPGPSAPEMKFQVLSASSLQQLNKLKKTRSHLALGVFYAREGMIAEAGHEFRTLVRDNPRSQHAKKLLKEVQSFQKHR